jgi:hypothetical protein
MKKMGTPGQAVRAARLIKAPECIGHAFSPRIGHAIGHMKRRNRRDVPAIN